MQTQGLTGTAERVTKEGSWNGVGSGRLCAIRDPGRLGSSIPAQCKEILALDRLQKDTAGALRLSSPPE